MFIWIFLFLIIVAISLVLAIQSMADYHKEPRHLSTAYSLFLISKLSNLNSETLNKLYKSTLAEGLIISFERLFKGSRTALTVFGPKEILKPFTEDLGLLEIEDYSRKTSIVLDKDLNSGKQPLAWEVGLKLQAQEGKPLENIFVGLPELGDEEEFWWQLVLQPMKKKHKDLDVSFQAVIRAVTLSESQERTQELQKEYLKIGKEQGLALFPQAYSTLQLIKLYQERTMPSGSTFLGMQKKIALMLKPKEVISLVDVKTGRETGSQEASSSSDSNATSSSISSGETTK